MAGRVGMPEAGWTARSRGLWLSLRPHQWFKNVFLFAALVFAKRLGDAAALGRAALGFILFCALSSAVYLVNDVRDREQDRVHPTKQRRPIASGQIAPSLAVAAAVILFAGALGGAVALGRGFFLTAAGYVVLSLAYCFGLKQVVIVDVMAVAALYTLRAVAGAEAITVDISNWLLICTSLLALFLGFCKRRQELTSLDERGVAHRAVLAHYTEDFLDQMIAVVTASTVMAYLLYVFSEDVAARLHTRRLALTAPFVLYGIFRYFYLVHVRGGGGHPARDLLADRAILVNLVLYGVVVVLILYALPPRY